MFPGSRSGHLQEAGNFSGENFFPGGENREAAVLVSCLEIDVQGETVSSQRRLKSTRPPIGSLGGTSLEASTGPKTSVSLFVRRFKSASSQRLAGQKVVSLTTETLVNYIPDIQLRVLLYFMRFSFFFSNQFRGRR